MHQKEMQIIPFALLSYVKSILDPVQIDVKSYIEQAMHRWGKLYRLVSEWIFIMYINPNSCIMWSLQSFTKLAPTKLKTKPFLNLEQNKRN